MALRSRISFAMLLISSLVILSGCATGKFVSKTESVPELFPIQARTDLPKSHSDFYEYFNQIDKAKRNSAVTKQPYESTEEYQRRRNESLRELQNEYSLLDFDIAPNRSTWGLCYDMDRQVLAISMAYMKDDNDLLGGWTVRGASTITNRGTKVGQNIYGATAEYTDYTASDGRIIAANWLQDGSARITWYIPLSLEEAKKYLRSSSSGYTQFNTENLGMRVVGKVEYPFTRTELLKVNPRIDSAHRSATSSLTYFLYLNIEQFYLYDKSTMAALFHTKSGVSRPSGVKITDWSSCTNQTGGLFGSYTPVGNSETKYKSAPQPANVSNTTVPTAASGNDFNENAIASLVPGKTTLAEAERILGAKPSSKTDLNGHTLAIWQYTKVTGMTVTDNKMMSVEFGLNGKMIRILMLQNIYLPEEEIRRLRVMSVGST